MNIFPSKTIKNITLVALSSIALLACNKQPTTTGPAFNEQNPSQVNAANIQAHIEFLADDTLQGRDTGSNGYQIAANYVKSYFKQLGLTPHGTRSINDHRSFEQEVRFRKSYLVDGSASAIIHGLSGDVKLEYVTDF